VLAMDTSTDLSSVSLLEARPRGEGEPLQILELAGRRLPPGRTHTHSLLRFAGECLEEAGSAPADLAAVLVGTGPGTFTGVRIGVASARALALSSEKPVLGVSSLSSLAAAALDEDRVQLVTQALVPLVDARRGQLFGTVYLRSEDGEDSWTWTGQYFVSDPGEVAAEVERQAPGRSAALVGSIPGSGLKAVEVSLRARHLLVGQEHLAPYPARPAGRGLHAWLAAEFRSPQAWAGAHPGVDGTPEAVLPVYVRSPDADVHIRKMRDPWA
jgi:tRNA threonylcarbamoyl adenosine modification protein YeaZ